MAVRVQAPSQAGLEPGAAPRVPRMERLETTSRPQSGDTASRSATRSSSVEWTQKAGACVAPFNLQCESTEASEASFWKERGPSSAVRVRRHVAV